MQIEILNSLKHRYAVKKFDSTKLIPADVWEVIEESLVLTPSSFGLAPWQFIVIQDKTLRAKLRVHSWGQSQIEDCSHLVVFASKKNIDAEYIESHIENIAKVREVPTSSLAEYKNRISASMKTYSNHGEYASNQTFIALGNILTVASLLKIDACPIGGFEPEKYNEILNISPEYTSVVVCAFGYRSNEDKYATAKKARRKKEDVIKHINS